ncbi:sphingosine kinase 1 [Discoglossus pictus]
MEDTAGGSCSTSSVVLLCDTFSLVPNGSSAISLALTRTHLLTHNLTPGAQGPPHPPLLIADCVGCRSFKGKDSADLGGYFTAVFYPLRGGPMRSTMSRQRISRTFRTEASRDREQNLTVARTWVQKILQLAGEQGSPSWPQPSSLQLLVLINPHGGTGKALTLFQSVVVPILTDADAQFTMLVTERPNQAYDLMRDEDLSRWDAIVVMSGDGLMFEVVNGLMERQDWASAIKKPLAILPSGSGNALAASISHYSGHQQVMGTKLLTNCTFVLCKGHPQPLDLVSLTTSTGRRIFSFLSLAWGFISDVDIESEKYRFMGSARFTLRTVVRLTALRSYEGHLSYLPADASLEANGYSETNPVNINSSLFESRDSQCLDDTLLVPLDQPVPNHWTTVSEDHFVLVLALCQSHLGADLYTAPMVKGPGEGIIHLFYATSEISRTSLLNFLLSMEKGTHLDTVLPHLTYVPVKAFRIEPAQSTGIMTVDGEVLESNPIQGQVHMGLGRVLSIPQGTGY